MPESVAPMPRRLGRPAIAVAGWAALAFTYYFNLPIFGVLSVFGWLILGGCWIWALAATALVAARLVRHRAFGRAIGVSALAIAVAVGIWNADWLGIYLKSQVWLHGSSLSALTSAHRAGALPANAPLPWQISYLSLDGQAHRQVKTNALYLPMWQNVRGEAGGGLVYLAEAPDEDTVIQTALGGKGVPHRYIGHGWWWVEGG